MNDPSLPAAQTTDGRFAARLKALEDDVAALRRARSIVTFGTGGPGSSVSTPFYLSEDLNRLYWRESNGAWLYAQG